MWIVFERANRDSGFKIKGFDDVIDTMQTLGSALSQKRSPNPIEPTEKPRIDLLEKDEVRAKRPSMWNVVF
jgi:hypothetical protein